MKPVKIGIDIPESYCVEGTIITYVPSGIYYHDPERLLKGRHYRKLPTTSFMGWEVIVNREDDDYTYLNEKQLEEVKPSEGITTDLEEE